MKCECCEENEGRYKLTLATMDGEVVAASVSCAECIIEARVTGRGAALDLGW